MAQCQKILKGGLRCSNRAVPGTKYCEEHRRINFRKVSKPVPPPKAPQQKRTTKKKQLDRPAWIARPVAAGDTTQFPGLYADGRNILVASQAMIRLGEAATEETPVPLFDRLIKLLASISQVLPLAEHVSINLLPEGSDALVHVLPPSNEETDLSRFYDGLASAAAFVDGVIYIGENRTFIRYRDGDSPRGYDASGVQVPQGDSLYLIDLDGTHPFSPTDMLEASLADLLLQAALLPVSGAALPEMVYVLAVPALYRMLARYFRAHHLGYRVARFSPSPADSDLTGKHPPDPPQGETEPTPGPSQEGKFAPDPSQADSGLTEDFMLFEVAARADAPAGGLVPKFVLSYLKALPRCAVLIEAGAEEGWRMLVEWSYRHPCLPQHMLTAFPPQSLLLFPVDDEIPNHCLTPVPAFFDGDLLITVQTPQAQQRIHVERDDQKGTEPWHSLEVPVRLVPDSGPTPSTSAVLLDAEESTWIRRLLYRLPGDLFSVYRVCQGRPYSVLLSEGTPFERLPFGIPMRRVQDTSLFLPLRSRLLPELPWSILAEVLEMKDSYYTFLLSDSRLDLPYEAFIPLSKSLVAEPGRLRVDFELRPASTLPELPWTGSTALHGGESQKPGSTALRGEESERPGSTPLRGGESERSGSTALHDGKSGKQEKRGFLERFRKKQASPEQAPLTEGSELEILRAQAESFRQDEDFLSAALCFALCSDTLNAAQCYQEAARRI